MQSDGETSGSDAASNAVQADRVPWARVAACAGVYTAPTALVVAPALADSRVLAATGWAPGALTLASGLMFVAARRAPSSARVPTASAGGPSPSGRPSAAAFASPSVPRRRGGARALVPCA